MLVNFVKLKNYGGENYEKSDIRSNNDEINENITCNLCFIPFLIGLLYFILNIFTVFMDSIFGFYNYINDIDCSLMNNWLIVNGIFGYVGLTALILIKLVYKDQSMCKKFILFLGIFANGLMLLFSAVSIAWFFKGFYNNPQCLSHPFFYNYMLIRIVLAPLINIYKIIEIILIK